MVKASFEPSARGWATLHHSPGLLLDVDSPGFLGGFPTAVWVEQLLNVAKTALCLESRDLGLSPFFTMYWPSYGNHHNITTLPSEQGPVSQVRKLTPAFSNFTGLLRYSAVTRVLYKLTAVYKYKTTANCCLLSTVQKYRVWLQYGLCSHWTIIRQTLIWGVK